MFKTPLNQRTVTVSMKRIDLCNLMLACTAIEFSAKQKGETGQKWHDLHDKLKSALDAFDKKKRMLIICQPAGFIRGQGATYGYKR